MDKLAEGGQMFKENISNSVSKSENIVVATTRTIIVCRESPRNSRT